MCGGEGMRGVEQKLGIGCLLLPRWFGNLPEETVRNVLAHKSRKMPLSPVDEYIVTPIGVAISKLLPRSISPNAISLFGGLCAMASAALVVIGASWGSATAHCMAGAFWVAYQLADVTDGAHARSTGQGSALGGIVDHCVDAVVCVFGAIATITVCDPAGLSRTLGIRCAVVLLIAFYGAQWAEHAGETFDDRGVVEMNIVSAFSLALPGMSHLDVFSTPVDLWFTGPMPLGKAVMVCVLVFACWQSISRVFMVVWQTRCPSLLVDFTPILMHWLAAEIFCSYMPSVSFNAWLVVQGMAFTAMSISAMKMRLAATVSAPWSALHAEVVPPLCLAAYCLVWGVPASSGVFLAALMWEVTVMVMLWYDLVTRICGLLDIPFLAPIPKRA